VNAASSSLQPADEEAHHPRTGEDRFAALPAEERALLLQVSEMLHSIRYGNVMIVVQDGKVIQMETSEKIRLR
jgi:hypothetical protein